MQLLPVGAVKCERRGRGFRTPRAARCRGRLIRTVAGGVTTQPGADAPRIKGRRRRGVFVAQLDVDAVREWGCMAPWAGAYRRPGVYGALSEAGETGQ